MSMEVHIMIAGQEEQKVPLEQSSLMIGSLLSSQINLRAAGVEPIHALLERLEGQKWRITDLGSSTGVMVNGIKIDVEAMVKPGDVLTLGAAILSLKESVPDALLPPPPLPFRPADASLPAASLPSLGQKALRKPQAEAAKNLLFTSQQGKGEQGDVLEVVAYWGETILEVEHFHPTLTGFKEVTIGEGRSCHFSAMGDESVACHSLVQFSGAGYRLKLLPTMTAKLRCGGKLLKVEGGGHSLAKGDIAHISHGAVNYFLLYMQPPVVELPPAGERDRFFRYTIFLAMATYLFLTISLWSLTPVEKEEKAGDDIWSIVHMPEKAVEIPKDLAEASKLAEVKVEPPPTTTPPPPKPKPVEAVKVEEAAKTPPPPKAAEEARMQENLSKAVTQEPPSKGRQEAMAKPAPAKSAPASGGSPQAQGGARKGEASQSIKGVDGVANQNPSGVNLSKLGLGVGKIQANKGPGAIHTQFRSTAGGAGGGQGSSPQTLGLGGVGAQVKSVGLAGSGGVANQFGAGNNGFLSGQDGAAGLSKAFGAGHKPTKVSVQAGDPLVSGGLTQQEILGVIRSQLNQIRHCYEKLLQRSPQSSGQIKVQFIVGVEGRVQNTKITSSTISDGGMQSCVTEVISRWAFPRPRGGAAVTVNYPFSFNPI